jgi:hypothetical protein
MAVGQDGLPAVELTIISLVNMGNNRRKLSGRLLSAAGVT